MNIKINDNLIKTFAYYYRLCYTKYSSGLNKMHFSCTTYERKYILYGE